MTVTYTVSRIGRNNELIDTQELEIDAHRLSERNLNGRGMTVERGNDGIPTYIRQWDAINGWHKVYVRKGVNA